MLTVSQAQITLDGSLGPKGPMTGPDLRIGAELGQIRGSNLLHSFGEFNVQVGESASFTGPATIANIVSRVTGGQRSLIVGRDSVPVEPRSVLPIPLVINERLVADPELAGEHDQQKPIAKFALLDADDKALPRMRAWSQRRDSHGVVDWRCSK